MLEELELKIDKHPDFKRILYDNKKRMYVILNNSHEKTG